MLRDIKYILCLILVLPFITGCSEGLYVDETIDGSYGELPIEFNFLLPDSCGTRGFEGNVKTSFKSDDVIHILAKFKTKELQESGKYQEGNITRYGALRFNGKNWIKVDGNELLWPSVAVSGTFTAFYISGSNGLLTNVTDVTNAESYRLSDICPADGDPLKAETKEDVVYGHAVSLRFEHLCTYLTLMDLEPQVSDSYWFQRGESEDFNNAYKFWLGEDDDKNHTLNFAFCQVADPDFENRVYIAAAAENYTDGEGENARNVVKASYFLEPGLYKTFSLCYPATKPDVYQYLEYKYEDIPDNAGDEDVAKKEPMLEAGKIYTLTITKSPGVTITPLPPGDGWDDTGSFYKVDVEAFLKAIYNTTDYDYTDTSDDGEGKTVRILEAVDGTVKLLHNVDFRLFNYSNFQDKNFVPNVKEGAVFDGGYHYIQNLGSPLFRYNDGTIKNVGIREIEIKTLSYDDNNENLNMSRQGALCMWNRKEGIINNVRVQDVTMEVYVKSELRAGGGQENGQEAHNIGCVIGSNTGKISEVALQGKFELNVVGYNEDDYQENVNARVFIGGFVGQNAAGGDIYDVSPFDDKLTISITNKCVGSFGSYSVGGIVGQSSGTITGVILSAVKIDGTSSEGVTSYMGGIAGELTVSSDVATSVESCIVSGSVFAGTSKKFGSLTSGSYIGGIAGAASKVSVSECRTAVSVVGSTTPQETDVIYATGGAFGRIRTNETLVKNITAYGSDLTGPQKYIGNFAGIVPNGQTWEEYSKNNILIRKFSSYEDIGGMLDSNNNEQ